MQKILIDKKKGELPLIPLTVRRVEASAFETLGFHKHHYLRQDINPSCKCLLFEWDGQPVGFVGILNSPRKGIPFSMSISRIVILPDYQGLHLSRRLCNFVGGIVKSLSNDTDNYRLYIKTAHQKMGQSLTKDTENWRGTAFDGKGRTKESTEYDNHKYANRLTRVSFCKEYIGKPIYGYEDLLLPISEMRKKMHV